MSTPISVKDKRDFMQWFLCHFELQKRESVWILKYILTYDDYLMNVHFVNDVSFSPRGLLVSTCCSNDVAFRYHKMHIVTEDPDQVFHDIRLNKNESLYIQLNFNHSVYQRIYASILEENPYDPTLRIHKKHDAYIAEKLLDQLLYEQQRKTLLQQVNDALDRYDKRSFLRLTHILQQITKKP